MADQEIVIVDGLRTPQGALGGVFRDLSAQKLGQVAVKALLEKTVMTWMISRTISLLQKMLKHLRKKF